MADVTADPAALRAVGGQLDDLVDGGPVGALDAAADCGSATVIAALADSTHEFDGAWLSAETSTATAGEAILAAADDYEATDAAVAKSSSSHAGTHSAGLRR